MVGFHFLAFTVILTALAWLSSASDLKTWCASRGTKAVYIGQTCFTTTEASQSFSANSLSCKDQQNGGLAILPSSDLIQDISSILTSETSNFHIGLGQVVTSNSDQTSDSQQKETQTSDTKASNPDASVTQIITTQIPTTTVKNRLPSKGIETEVVNPETSQILTSRRRKRSTSTNGDQTTSINGNWLWADANKNTFGQNPDIKWQTGESNVANGDQNCAAMAKSGEIVAVSCSANLRAICQYRESKMVYRLSQVGYK
uniref:C-type lectin domain-containing protein n=1 Tax=Plectus sambesii TaxID=2011161 RepID=A0A914UXC1_9BILA